MDELHERLKRLAARGEPRGANVVLGGARASAVPAPRPGSALMTAAAILAGVAVILSGGALITRGDSGKPTAARLPVPTSTTSTELPPTTFPPPTTTASAPVRVSTRLIAASRLQTFASCSALLTQVRNKALEVVGPYGLPGTTGMPVINQATAGGARDASPPLAAAPASGTAEATPAFSQTNVQEKGIDEPDQVKTDGTRLFAVAQGKLWALRADGPRLLGSLAADGAQEILLIGDRVVVFGSAPSPQVEPAPPSDVRTGPAATGARPYFQQRSQITVVDVSNPAAMKVVGQLDVDGAYLSARLVNGVARVVLRTQPRGMSFVAPRDNSPAAQAEATGRNREIVRSSTLANWTPTYWSYDGTGQQRAAGQLGSCTASYRPPEFSGFGMLTVLNFDTARPERSPATSVMADGEIVYASADRLYVATNQWGRVEGPTVHPSPRSLVHQFDITDPTGPRYRLSGQLRGTVLNQFSMSEQGAYLRVASTEDDGTGKGESFVTVLGDGGGALVPVGTVGGLGHGERIYAVRFIGDVGYVVTFHQVDPLYTIDLSDPRRPRVVGQLKIPGFSAYLHPIGPGLLLGVGQDVSPEGRPLGTQVSVFDVSDLRSPRRLAQRSLGASSSPAEFDHHAFLYWEPTGLAVLPIQQYQPQFSGAVGLKVARTGITEVGRVTHPPDPRYGGSLFISRSLVIGARLFTLSDGGVLASDLNTLADRGFVRFA